MLWAVRTSFGRDRGHTFSFQTIPRIVAVSELSVTKYKGMLCPSCPKLVSPGELRTRSSESARPATREARHTLLLPFPLSLRVGGSHQVGRALRHGTLSMLVGIFRSWVDIVVQLAPNFCRFYCVMA